MNTLILPSFAKVNLYLKVVKKRKDNYHDLVTIFERIGLADTVRLSLRPDSQIRIFSSCKDIPLDENNFCYKAARLLQDFSQTKKGVDIHLVKRIPLGAGLGGGSSNAAVVLSGLNKLWQLGLPRKILLSLANKVGADVPFFILDVPFALGQARGDDLVSLTILKKILLWHLIVVPKINVPTPEVFKVWDELKSPKPQLTRIKKDVKLIISGLKEFNLSKVSAYLQNDLEVAALNAFPSLKAIPEKLKQWDMPHPMMTGSGSGFFVLFSSFEEAKKMYHKIKGGLEKCRVLLAGTR